MKLRCGSKITLLAFGFCFVGLVCLCRADAIFENVGGSAEVLFPPNGAIFYGESLDDVATVTATGKSKISYIVTTDHEPLSVLHTYSIVFRDRTEEGEKICRYLANTTKSESVAIGPDVLTLMRYCGVGDYFVGVNHQAINVTTGQIIAAESALHNFEVKVMPATGGFQGLGSLPGGSVGSNASDVSADGSVVVGDVWVGLGKQAFRWTQDGGMVGLGDLPGGYGPRVYGVSADGSVVVGAVGGEAFRWTQDGGMVGLGYLPGGDYPGSIATGVSADGSIVVGQSSIASGHEAFRWTQGGGMIGLGDLPGGYFGSLANAVSADGSVVVGYGTCLVPSWLPYPGAPDPFDVDTKQAFRWENGTMTGLGFLPDLNPESMALAVSADGSVVVGTGTWRGEAFRWENGTMTSLGLGLCTLYDVSADVSVIVGKRSDGAIIWDAYHGVRNLQDVLVNDYRMDLRGFYQGVQGLWEATGISDDGFTIVGTGTNSNREAEAWIATLDMGMITAVRGNVTLDTIKAEVLDRFGRLSVLETEGDGKVRFEHHPSGSEIDIGPNSKMQVDGSPAKTNLDLIYGRLKAKVKRIPGGLEVITPQEVMAVRGTEFVVETTMDESKTIVLEGEVDVSTPDGSQTITLGQNQGIIVTAAGLGVPFTVDPSQIDRWWEWEDVCERYNFGFDVENVYLNNHAIVWEDEFNDSIIDPAYHFPEESQGVYEHDSVMTLQGNENVAVVVPLGHDYIDDLDFYVVFTGFPGNMPEPGQLASVDVTNPDLFTDRIGIGMVNTPKYGFKGIYYHDENFDENNPMETLLAYKPFEEIGSFGTLGFRITVDDSGIGNVYYKVDQGSWIAFGPETYFDTNYQYPSASFGAGTITIRKAMPWIPLLLLDDED